MTAPARRARRFPFLHRNWIKSTNHWYAKMGNKSSSLTPPDSGEKLTVQAPPSQQPPSKRRKMNNASSEYDGFPLFPGYTKMPYKLRLEILKINHKSAPRLKNGILNGLVAPPVKSMRARCKVTIFASQDGKQITLYVDNQLCDVKVYKNPTGTSYTARISDIHPFEVPAEKIFLPEDGVLTLAPSYGVFIELESAGDMKWPPSHLIPLNDEDTFSNRILPPRQWALNATIPDLFNSLRCKAIPLNARKHADRDTKTDFVMDVDARWLLPAISSQLTMKQEKEILPEIHAIDPDAPAAPYVNGVTNGTNGVQALNGHSTGHVLNGDIDMQDAHTNGVSDTVTDMAESKSTTPSRSQRARPQVNYNVKDIWAKSVGKETTKKRRRSDDKAGQQDEHTITYKLHPEQFKLDHYQCFICGAEHHRMDQLRFHFGSNHSAYDFSVENKAAAGWVVGIKPANRNNLSTESSIRLSIYQLGLPTKPLDLGSLVDGDTSWVDSRLGPDNIEVAIPQMPKSNIPQVGTSCNDLVMIDKDQVLTTTQKRAAKRPRKRVFVPAIKQPLFDPLSKATLAPGTEVRQVPVDDEWLILKHRDTLQDFTDLDNNEKEFMTAWDAFILKKHISSEAYLPRELVRFTRKRAQWIIESRARAVEFTKHVTLLLARRVINESTIEEVTSIINDARTASAPEAPEVSPARRDPGSCAVCQELVPLSALIICSNKVRSSAQGLPLWVEQALKLSTPSRIASTGCTMTRV